MNLMSPTIYRWSRSGQTAGYGMATTTADVLSGLVLPPVAVMAGVFAAWRLSSDIGWTSGFFITTGPLSHYQLWAGISIASQMSVAVLKRWSATRMRSFEA